MNFAYFELNRNKMSPFRYFVVVVTIVLAVVFVSTTYRYRLQMTHQRRTSPSSLLVLLPHRRERGDLRNSYSASRVSVSTHKYRILKHKRGRPKVELVHITKTGGSALEAAAADAGITWGACHYNGNLENIHCNKITNREAFTHSKEINELAVNLNSFKSYGMGAPWHIPPHWFKEYPFEGRITFVMVRNPYERLISEFYCPWAGYKGPSENLYNATIMNEWIRNEILRTVSEGVNMHKIPQHFYVYDKFGNRVVDHILHFEYYDHDIMQLSNWYDLGLSLPQEVNEAKQGDDEEEEEVHQTSIYSKLTINDFDAETICVVNEFYRMDFEKFGYNMMHEDHCKERSPYIRKKIDKDGNDEVIVNNDNDIDNSVDNDDDSDDVEEEKLD